MQRVRVLVTIPELEGQTRFLDQMAAVSPRLEIRQRTCTSPDEVAAALSDAEVLYAFRSPLHLDDSNRLGWAMLHPGRGRRIGALLGASVAAGGALVLSIVHFSGRSVRGCGCFGPIELPYGLHMIVCAMLFAACVFALRSEAARLRVEALVARVFDSAEVGSEPTTPWLSIRVAHQPRSD